MPVLVQRLTVFPPHSWRYSSRRCPASSAGDSIGSKSQVHTCLNLVAAAPLTAGTSAGGVGWLVIGMKCLSAFTYPAAPILSQSVPLCHHRVVPGFSLDMEIRIRVLRAFAKAVDQDPQATGNKIAGLRSRSWRLA